jgi:hypothetical protein
MIGHPRQFIDGLLAMSTIKLDGEGLSLGWTDQEVKIPTLTAIRLEPRHVILPPHIPASHMCPLTNHLRQLAGDVLLYLGAGLLRSQELTQVFNSRGDNFTHGCVLS